MTTEAPSAAAPPDQVRSPVAAEHVPRRHRRAAPAGRRAPTRTSADPVRDDLVVIDMVTRAGNGDEQAWDALVERYSPLIWSICRRHRLGGADAEDVGQIVWLQLVDPLARIRDPAALPGWLATTTRRECLRILRMAPAVRPAGCGLDPETFRMSRPRRPSRSCWQSSATPRCARRSGTWRHPASS